MSLTYDLTVGLTSSDRAELAKLADQLIPGDGAQPSASQAEVASVWIDEALRIRPDLKDLLHVALELGARFDAGAAIDALHREHPDAFDALGTLTAGAYFLNPRVRALIGYPGQVSVPLRDDVDTYVDMLEKVVDRGPVYRPTPG
jgi:hypothetical protein